MSNAIIYLLNNAPKDILFFRKSIYLLNKNYLENHPCDVICLHEADFPNEEKLIIQKISAAPIQFVPIQLEMPNYPEEIKSKIPEFVPHPEITSVPGFPMGYRYMCRFFAGEVFKKDYLRQYKYVWRLDTDSLILSPIRYDVFRRMEESKAKYGYINIQFDHPKMTLGLWEEAAKYFEEKGIRPLVDLNDPAHKNRVFYTNFEIFDMDWFRSGVYQDYYNHIDAAGGIFINRWGDHCIRYIAVRGMLKEEETLFLDDVHYYHSREFLNNKIIDTHG
jgi:hypothetical protein